MSKGSRRRPTNIPLAQSDANFEGIFGKKVPTYLKKLIPDEPIVKEMKQGTCGCGRSPTGDCCGWHGLTEEQYKVKLEEYMTNREDINGNDA